MRKWIKVMLIAAAVIVLTFIIIYFAIYNPQLSSGGVRQIDIITLPSPPKEKVVTRKEDINTFINYYNTTQKHPLLSFGLSGWQMSIKVNQNNIEHRITLSGNMMNVDGRWYTVDKDVLPSLEKLYSKFEYQELNYINGG